MPLYFAYGSNLATPRIRQAERAPRARRVGTARLERHILRFHKRGDDGSGKCNVWCTGDDGDWAWGVLWEVAPAELERLDAVEGGGYRRLTLEVTVNGSEPGAGPAGDAVREAETYVARHAYVDLDLSPYDWYKAIVLAGAREHALPRDWVRFLDTVDTWRDLDEARASRHWAILG